MNLETILGRLEQQDYTIEHMADPKQEVHGLRFLSKNMGEIQSDILYVGDIGRMPEHIHETMFFSFILIGPGKLAPIYHDSKNVNIIRFGSTVDPFEQYNRLQEYFLEDQILTSRIRRLLSAFFSNKGLQYMVDEAAEIMGNPILVVDNSYKYIARSLSNITDEDHSKFADIMREELSEQQIMDQGLDYIRKANLDETSGNIDRPIYHYNEMMEIGTMIGVIRIRNIIVGHVLMAQKNHEFKHLDEEVFIRLVHFVTQELQKIPIYQKNRGQMISYFLIDLLQDVQPSVHNAERQMKLIHFKPLGKYYIAVIKTEEMDLGAKDAEALAEQMRGILTGNIYAAYKDTFVILFNREGEHSIGEYTMETLKKYARINKMKTGISNEFYEITEAGKFYHQALKAVEYGNIIHKEKTLFLYEDFSYMEMLDICREQANMFSFCVPAVFRLLKYDEENGTEFMKTLYHYLEHNGNTANTSKSLFIHKNTLLYRMDKIRQMLGNDLTGGESMFMLHLSFRILIQMNRFDPQEKPEEEN
ncbi:MAG: helix-turn-helix domain-containing protein [Lachnospiraceae bacterium]